jgi:hypothetical protein
LKVIPDYNLGKLYPELAQHWHAIKNKDLNPSDVTLEGSEPLPDKWPKVKALTPNPMKIVYPGAGSELYHGKKKTE